MSRGYSDRAPESAFGVVVDVSRGGAKLDPMQRLDDIFIVPAGPGDAFDLAEVHVRAWRETYAGLLPAAYLARMEARLHARRWRSQLTTASSGDVILAAEGREGLVGYLAGRLTPGATAAEVFTLYVLRDAQRKGLGSALLASAARAFAKGGATKLQLWVLDGNVAAHAFYAHLGGVVVGHRPVRGWGGDLGESAYRWDDIGRLTRR
jgi:ribosomal protein S18 acetylase RimI-like enzyme